MAGGVGQEGQELLKARGALEAGDFPLHVRHVAGEIEGSGLLVGEPDAVVGVALDEAQAFGLHAGVEVVEDFVEEFRHQKQRGTLVESLVLLAGLLSCWFI